MAAREGRGGRRTQQQRGHKRAGRGIGNRLSEMRRHKDIRKIFTKTQRNKDI